MSVNRDSGRPKRPRKETLAYRGHGGGVAETEKLTTCPSCGKEFLRDRRDRRYCSPECATRKANRRRPKQLEGGAQTGYSAIATVKAPTGEAMSAVGWATRKSVAREAAVTRAAARLGLAVEDVAILSVSTPDSIYADLMRTA